MKTMQFEVYRDGEFIMLDLEIRETYIPKVETDDDTIEVYFGLGRSEDGTEYVLTDEEFVKAEQAFIDKIRGN